MPDRRLAVGLALLLSCAAVAGAQTWTPLVHHPTFNASTALLLTDGTVMVQADESRSWWRLTPDNTGSYVNGTWSQLASTAADYAPLYYASAVLPDGRLVIEGGEYNFGDPVWSTQGAIYNPANNTWTSINPPAGWTAIGDAQSVVLADGTFMVADIFSGQSALLNPATLAWTIVPGIGKADAHDEEGWNLLPDGRVLTVDCNNTANLTHAEIFDPVTKIWSSAGSTIVKLPDLEADGSGSHEIGPAVLRPDGTVFAAGATPNTAIYNSATGVWTAGPTFPNSLGIADGPAALLPNGNVLMQAGSGFDSGTQFFEFNGSTLTQVANPPNAPFEPAYVGRMLVLPTGQILFTDGSTDAEIYTASGTYQSSWKPTISTFPPSVNVGGTGYAITGTQFNGLSQGGYYGDDAQSATNYPLVRITNTATGHVKYAKTHDHSSMGVATGTATVSTLFDVPVGTESGASTLQVVANGIPSDPVAIQVSNTPPDFYTLTPCRLVDTRNANSALGGPALGASSQRTFVLAGICGIPADARAVSLNLTVTQTAAAGDLRMFPASQGAAPVASVINFHLGQTLANNAILSLDTNGAIKVQNDATGIVHLILDVNGYFR